MIKITSLLLLIAFLYQGCNHNVTSLKTSKDPVEGIDINWQVVGETAEKMQDYFKNCTRCEEPRFIVTIKRMEKEIMRVLEEKSIKVESVSWIDARYREEDQARYKARNKSSDEAGMVAGYATKLMKVSSTDTNYYFDISRVCPPPPNCGDLEEESGTSQSQAPLPKDSASKAQ